MVLAGVFGTSSPKPSSKLEKFEIRLDNEFILIRGHEDVAVTGVVVLMISEPLSLKCITIILHGKWKVGWDSAAITPTPGSFVGQKCHFLHESRTLYVKGNQGGTMPAGNHEFPFQFELSGQSMQSVEGALDNYIVYDLKADIERGYMKTDMHAQRHLRVVRTVGPATAEEELIHPLSCEDVWPAKVVYKVTIPNKMVIFGSIIKVDLELTPLLKGLTLGKVKVFLYEKQELRTTTARTHKSTLLVASNSMVIPEEAFVAGAEGTDDDKYVFQAILQLPKSLKDCRQDVESKPITIEHELKVNVQLHNPDGHVSETKFCVKLVISPNHIIGDDQEVSQVQNTTGPIDPYEIPPSYELHVLDDLYSDIDPSGFITPGLRSGIATPGSRSASVENLASLNDAAQNGPSSTALQARLTSLQAAALPPSPANNAGTGSSGEEQSLNERINANGYLNNAEDNTYSQGPASYGSMSRSASEDEATMEGVPNHIEYDLDALIRIPTYTTATRSRPQQSLSDEAPPTYGDATSRQPSPRPEVGSRRPSALSISLGGRSRQASPSGLQLPGQAHIRRNASSGLLPEAGGAGRMLPIRSQLPHRTADDEEARLRLLRAR